MKNRSLIASALLAPFSLACHNADPSAESDPLARRISQTVDLSAGTECLVPEIDHRRSLAATEVELLANFDLRDVLSQLISQGPNPTQDPSELFQEWSLSHECPGGDDTVSFNDFELPCRPETAEDLDPFGEELEVNGYMPVGVFNRFDLAAADGRTCGEYRMVFARKSGLTDGFRRRFIIFEAVLPNPTPEQGISACLPVAEFWAALSSEESVAARGAALRTFFMDGLPGFSPVVHINNYGFSGQRGTGQIRTNNFLSQEWHLAEFQPETYCDGTDCRLRIARGTAQDVPANELFGAVGEHALTSEFQDDVLIAAALDPNHPIHSDNLNLIRFSFEDRFHAGDSNATAVNPFRSPFFRAQISGFMTHLDDALAGSSLTGAELLRRVETQTCGGCHGLQQGRDIGGGVTWPQSLGFTHTSERTEEGPEGPRHLISPGLVDDFLPFRAEVLDSFLSSQLCEVALGSFDDLSDWNVEGATPSLDMNATEGASSLRLAHSGGTVKVVSRPFLVQDELGSSPSNTSIDLFVPSVQPNPWYLGDARLELHCPSAGVHSGYLGSVGLSNLPRDQFSTQTFSFPSWIANALSTNPTASCEFSVVLSVQAGAGDYLVDGWTVE